MKMFLQFKLDVPQSQITVLENERATRSGILKAIEALRQDSKIKLFDPILIYYAGHGCKVRSPIADLGNSEAKTECLVPWDVCKGTPDKKEIPPIPDYTIAALLDELAAEKGNNIVSFIVRVHSRY
jgi:hypothetical protein